MSEASAHGPWQRIIRHLIDNKLWVLLGVLGLLAAGVYVAPFRIGTWLPRAPLRVDALPDLGENQQIVFTEWPGHSPQDVDDEITYPLSAALTGMPGVRTVRGSSIFGASSIYVIFDDDVDFYWSRSRVSEKLGSLSRDMLPPGVTPMLGPDATALGQVFWYTLEGRDSQGRTVGGWDLHELRQVQDSTVRIALQSVQGVAEVASVGGYVKEFQVDVDPAALAKHKVTLEEVVTATRAANASVGARTLEINRVEYMVRGLGQMRHPGDLESAVVKPGVLLRDVAKVNLGPALRRGALDDAGAETVGGVVVARFGSNPLEVIERIKQRITEISPGLPTRGDNGPASKITIVPFYDRSELIDETLGTLSSSLWQQILVTVLTVLMLMQNMRGALLIAGVLPLAVVASLVAMKLWGLDVNFMALAGISIAIGTMVDMAIVLSENIVQKLKHSGEPRAQVIATAAAEVAPAVLTAGLTTAVSFLPVFAFTGAEGKLFAPMAYTKTFAMFSALLVTLLVLPPLAHVLLRPVKNTRWASIGRVLVLTVTGIVLVHEWMPLGQWRGYVQNALFVAALLAALFFGLWAFQRLFALALRWSLKHKLATLAVPLTVTVLGLFAWLGAPGFLHDAFPGFGREFMPPFDEGAYLYMPTMTDQASIGGSLAMLREMDAAIQTIPEIDKSIGKLGRVDSALDPAPISMFETLITYKPEYRIEKGERIRQWRDHIRTPDDIWKEIVAVTEAPGLTGAPRLMPIATRVLMLQTGMRASLGIKLHGTDLQTLQDFGMTLEEHLRRVPSIRPETVFAERIIGKPALNIELDRDALAKHGISIDSAAQTVETAIGGTMVGRVSIDRERYNVRVRYMREERDSVEAMRALRIQGVPLSQLADIRYVRTPQIIRSEDGRLLSFVVFDKQSEVAEVDVVEEARKALANVPVPPGVSYAFSGTYENHVHSQKRLLALVPLALLIMIMLVHLEFRHAVHTLVVISGIAICMAGGFLLVWLYGKPWFLAFKLFDIDFRELFQVGTVNLSLAVWVGFIALLGIATDAGVVMGIYLKDIFAVSMPKSVDEIHTLAIEAAQRRVLPCMMTTAAAALSLLPMFTSHGRGSDVLLPMALPSVGGMATILLTLFTVPVLFVWLEERALKRRSGMSTDARG